MNLKQKLFFILLITGVFISSVNAQSELVVKWDDDIGDVKVNALYDAIIADSLRPADRVYVLQAGGYYWNTERIDNDGWHLRIIGEAADPTNKDLNPPVLQMAAREDASSTDGIIRGKGDITIKNVWMTGAFTSTGDQTTYQPFQIDASNSTIIVDNCIFDRSNYAMIAVTGAGNDITVTNCKFRNLIGRPSSQQWEGRGISIWTDQKRVVIENNTFFNVGMTAIQIENGAADYLRVVHNTFVNIGRNIILAPWIREAYLANNIIVNGFWHAEGYDDYSASNREPEQIHRGLFEVGELPSMYGPEEGRRILLTKTAATIAQEFKTFYSDSLRVPNMVDDLSKLRHFGVYDNIQVSDTMWVDPVLNTDIAGLYSDMIKNISDLRDGISPAQEYFYMLPSFDNEECVECVSWPIPEDFSYTNQSLQTASTNGLPLGDLNWFPDAKSDWEMNYSTYITAIEDLAGPKIVYDVIEAKEAESGTLAGEAEILKAEGLSYYAMSSGFVEWEFDVPAAGQYDIDLYLHLNGRGTSGVNFFVNDFEIHDPRGWGQYVFGNDDANTTVNAGFDINSWGWWLVKQDEIKEVMDDASLTPLYLEAGKNKITIKASWCDNRFGGFKLKEAGTENVAVHLTGADVTDYSVATPVLEGAPWAPQWFKSVALKGGSTSMDFTVAENGEYVVQVFYQNYSGESTGDILVNGSEVKTFTYKSEADSTGLSGLSDAFALSAGNHSVGLSGNGVNVDYVQLIKKSNITSIDDLEIPEGYELSQNYPNPFNPVTTIDFSIGESTDVKLVVYNVLGQKVKTLKDEYMAAGKHSIKFDAQGLASGVYFYSLKAGDFNVTKKLMVLK